MQIKSYNNVFECVINMNYVLIKLFKEFNMSKLRDFIAIKISQTLID